MSVKRKQAEREAVAIEGDDSDDPERVEHDRMASVLAGRGKLWTTDLAELLADRGNFAVFEGEKRRWLAVVPEGEWKWVVDTGKGSIVPSAINAAVKALGKDLATFDPEKYADDSDVDERLSGSGGTASLSARRFKLPVEMDDQLRNKLLPGLMLRTSRVLEPMIDGIFCSDGKVVMDSGEVRKIVATDYCWKAVGFPSTVLSVEPAGFADWHAAWKEVQHSDVVDTVVASACLLRKPVLGEVAFDSTDLLDLLNDVAGDVDLCAADGLNGYRIQTVPPEGTTVEMLVYAAMLAKDSVKASLQNTMRGSSSSSRAVTSLKLNSVVKESGRIPPDVHASHILYSCLRTSPLAREEPMKHWVELSHIKKILEPSGKTYAHQKPVEEIMGKTFIDPPKMIDGNKTRAINAGGWVITGVHCINYTESVVPRTWVPKQMQETDPEVAALVESEDEGK